MSDLNQFKRNTRAPIPVLEEHMEYKRIKFSLKMALRLVGGSFSKLDIKMFN
jgi:hypothetical protein